MIDISQPVNNAIIFSTMGILLLITVLGIAAVLWRKRAMKTTKDL